MAILSRCCGCCTIRSGSIAAAIYSMIHAALALGLSSYKIHIYEIHGLTSGMSKEENALFIATCVDLGFFSLLFLLSIILLYGIKNNKRFLLLPYIVCMTVLVILLCVLILLLMVVVVTSVEAGGGVMELLIVSVFTGVNLYCVLCVTSLYQELKEGRYGVRALYRAQGGRLQTTDDPTEKMENVNNLENANFIPQYPGPPPPPGDASCAAAAPAPAPGPYPVPYPGSMMGAPPPYQPPQYPAETYPKAELQTV